MRVALVSDPLFVYGGAERVVEQILMLFPAAEVFALVDVLAEEQRCFLGGRAVRTSFVQGLPLARRHFRKYLHLWPRAIEQLDLTGYDLVISSHHAVAHGVITRPGQVHLSYTHSPMRYAWDLQHRYLNGAGLRSGPLAWWARRTLHQLRLWDVVAGQRPDAYMANSAFVASRIERVYRRKATVIFPPVDVDDCAIKAKRDGDYVAVGRLVPYKGFDLLVEAFRSLPDRRLVIAGGGPDLEALRRIAPGNVELIGWQPRSRVIDLMAGARAFLFAGIEDFGIAPLEAQACGTPVIALAAGGLRETIRGLGMATPTGVMFAEATPPAIATAVRRFEREGDAIQSDACRANALRFSAPRFRKAFAAFVAGCLEERGDDASAIAFRRAG